MATHTLKLLDLVALLRDLPDHGLARGELGTVVGVYDEAVEVEFSDDEGRTYGLLAVKPDSLLRLHQRAAEAA